MCAPLPGIGEPKNLREVLREERSMRTILDTYPWLVLPLLLLYLCVPYIAIDSANSLAREAR